MTPANLSQLRAQALALAADPRGRPRVRRRWWLVAKRLRRLLKED